MTVHFVYLNGRRCRVCDQSPRFFHENEDGTVTCCKHSAEHEDIHIDIERSEGASE